MAGVKKEETRVQISDFAKIKIHKEKKIDNKAKCSSE